MSVPLPAPDGPVTTKTGRDEGTANPKAGNAAAAKRTPSGVFARPGSAQADSGLAHNSRAVVEKLDELGPLALGESADGLRLADPALVEKTRSLYATELRDRHEHVEDLRRRHELGWMKEDPFDLLPPGLEVALELRAPDAHVVGPLERLHPLVQGSRGCLRVRLRRDHEPDESTKVRSRVKPKCFSRFPGLFPLSILLTKPPGRPIPA